MTALAHRLDEKVNLKHVYRRVQALARLLVVFTFADDAVRVATDYRGQVRTFQMVGWPQPQLVPVACVIVQSIGVIAVLSDLRPQLGCGMLIVWTTVHPFLYAQQTNFEFVLESVTVIGGLFILLSSERAKSRALQQLPSDLKEEKHRLLLVGRVCVAAVFFYYCAKGGYERIGGWAGSNHEDPLVAALDGVLLVLLGIVTGLMVFGMKSRACALLLALIMTASALYTHPWYITMWSTQTFRLSMVVGFNNRKVSAWLYSDHQRYFFFQQMSTVGALLQIVVHGPGKYSILDEQNESAATEMETLAIMKGCD